MIFSFAAAFLESSNWRESQSPISDETQGGTHAVQAHHQSFQGRSAMKQLHLAKDFAVPLDIVTQTLAAIGRKGAGKTYLATMIAEQMLDAAAQVVVFDPVGNWYGLRIGADGKSKGKEIFVIGGEHGDVPLVAEAGARIARLLVEKKASAVLDISGFRMGERKRFAAEFAEEFFHLKKTQRSPVHLFIEEAQLFIPQRVGPDEARMVGAWESIVRLGRNYGIGCTLVTQRPQSVNKEVLSQVECLCVLQVNGSHERKALEEWVQEAGAERALVGKLPGLGRGEGYIWSPSWLRVFQKVHFSKKTTFDASATPEVGKEAAAASLTSVDVEVLRADMAEVVAAAEKDDPKALQRRIRELEAEKSRCSVSSPNPATLQRARQEGASAERARWTAFSKKVCEVAARAHQESNKLMAALEDWPREAAAPPIVPAGSNIDLRALRTPRRIELVPRPDDSSKLDLPKAERLILTALAQYPQGRSKIQVALLTEYSHAGGGFTNAVSSLRGRGLIEGGPELLRITQAGAQVIGPVDALPSGVDLLRRWQAQLGRAEREILDVLFESYPNPLTKAEIAERTASKYQADGGGFTNSISKLRTLELIKGRRDLVLSEDLVS